MPKELHDKLEREFRAKGLKGEQLNHVVYGTMNKIEKLKAHGPSHKPMPNRGGSRGGRK